MDAQNARIWTASVVIGIELKSEQADISRLAEARLITGRDLRPPDCDDITTIAVTDLTTAKTRRRKVLVGLIHEHERAA